MNETLKKIQTALDKINNPYPPGNLIESYEDYLEVKDSIPFYQFNPEILKSMLRIVIESWDLPEKKEAQNVLYSSVCYSFSLKKRRYPIDEETGSLIFEIFRKSIKKLELGSSKYYFSLKSNAYRLLKDIQLKESEQVWLCENFDVSDDIDKLVLHYPERSNVIYNWVKENYTESRSRIHRAKFASWMIGEDPDFEIDRESMIADY